MTQDLLRPLQGLHGAIPSAPDWFNTAIAAPYDALEVTVDGVRIEGRAWGRRGDPGLVLLHGNAAHLGWWSFLAPMLTHGKRVLALSFSGMGASGWRDRYTIEGFVDEMWAMTAAAGIGDQPILVGHSIGGMPVLRASAQDRPIRAAIIVDTALPTARVEAMRPARRSLRTYADEKTALERFRLSPIQPCENAFIADYLARMGLRRLPGGDYDWRFDPRLWSDTDFGDCWDTLAAVKVPLAILRGELSELTAGDMLARMRQVAPAGTPFIEIAGAYHHVMVDQPLALVSVLRTLMAAWA